MKPPAPDQRTLTVTRTPGLTTTPEEGGERLDHFLGRQWPDLSRSRVEQLIAEGLVTVDQKSPKPSRQVDPGSTIDVIVPALVQPSAEPEAIPLDVVFEDAHLIVVDKPAGMVVHPAPGHPSGTLVNALLHHCGDLSGIGGVLRPGIVHRLDKDTSGLIVVAKSQAAHVGLSDALKRRDVSREYLALVWGEPEPSEGTIETWIGRSRGDRKRMAAFTERPHPLEKRWGRPAEEEEYLATLAGWEGDPAGYIDEDDADGDAASAALPHGVPSGSRPAVTHFETEEALRIASLLHCRLETGRTHQIRVHLQYHGHPVVGDPVYGGREPALKGMSNDRRERATELLTGMPRQALHATRLAFVHPVEGEERCFTAPLPEDLDVALVRLRGGATRS